MTAHLRWVIHVKYCHATFNPVLRFELGHVVHFQTLKVVTLHTLIELPKVLADLLEKVLMLDMAEVISVENLRTCISLEVLEEIAGTSKTVTASRTEDPLLGLMILRLRSALFKSNMHSTDSPAHGAICALRNS